MEYVWIVERNAKNNKKINKCYRNIKFMVINPCVFECGVLICIRINLDIAKTLRYRKKMLRGWEFMKKRIVCLTLALLMSATQVVSVSASREDELREGGRIWGWDAKSSTYSRMIGNNHRYVHITHKNGT